MKTKNSFLMSILFSSTFMFMFFSCQKDEAVHLLDPGLVHAQSSQDANKAIRTIDDFSDFEISKETIEGLTSDPELAKALEKLSASDLSFGNVGIRSFACADGGETLLVYNPNDPNLNVYDSREYQVFWLRAGELAGTRARLQCICQGRYAVIVLNRINKVGIGKAFYFSPVSCNPDDSSQTIGNDNY